MTQPAPDTYPAPAHSTVASGRPTAPLVGGATPVHPGTYARAAGLPIRRDMTTDEQLSAELERRRSQARRRIVKLTGTGIAVAGTPTLVLVAGPKSGFQWDLRRLTIGPPDYSAGSFPTGIFVAALITVQEEPGPTIDDASRVVSTTTSYPAEGTWGRGEASLVPGDYLRVLITGLPNNAVVTIGGQCEEVALDTITGYGL